MRGRARVRKKRWQSMGRGYGWKPEVKRLNIQRVAVVVFLVMKNLLTLTVTAIAMAALVATTFAGDGGCGACPVSGDKAKDKKTEEGTQS